MTTGFSTLIYRQHSLDLRDMTDVELAAHFSQNSHERRLYGPTESTAEFISMRWLRGNGIEIGAGNKPISLFGNARVQMNDFDQKNSSASALHASQA